MKNNTILFRVIVTALLIAMTAAGCAFAATVVPPYQVTEIEELTFYGNKALTRFVAPDGVETISEWAFAESGLSTLYLPTSVSSIDSSAFDGCGHITVYAEPNSTAETQIKRMIANGADIGISEMYTLHADNAARSAMIEPNGKLIYLFTARSSGIYGFTGSSIGGTEGTLYSADGQVLAKDSTGYDGCNFLIDYNMTAGQTVILEVKADSAGVGEVATVRTVTGRASAAERLYVGTADIAIAKGETVRNMFRAPDAGNYFFYSLGKADTYATLYDSYGSEIISSDDDVDFNFMIGVHLQKDELVYLDVKYVSAAKVGTMTVVVEREGYDTNDLMLGDNRVMIASEQTAERLFRVPMSGYYRFRFISANSIQTELVDANGNMIADSADIQSQEIGFVRYLADGDQLTLKTRFGTASEILTDSGSVNVRIERVEEVELSLGTTTVHQSAGVPAECCFTADTEGYYIFRSTGSGDVAAVLSDADDREIGRDEPGLGGGGFCIRRYMRSGESVRLSAWVPSAGGAISQKDEAFSVSVEKAGSQLTSGDNYIYLSSGTVSASFTAGQSGNWRFTFDSDSDITVKLGATSLNDRISVSDIAAGETVSFTISGASGTEVRISVEREPDQITVGENTITVVPSETTVAVFTAPFAGRYSFGYSGSDPIRMIINGTENCEGTSISAEKDMSEGERVRIQVSRDGITENTTAKILIEQLLIEGRNDLYTLGTTASGMFTATATDGYRFTVPTGTAIALYSMSGTRIATATGTLEQSLNAGDRIRVIVSATDGNNTYVMIRRGSEALTVGTNQIAADPNGTVAMFTPGQAGLYCFSIAEYDDLSLRMISSDGAVLEEAAYDFASRCMLIERRMTAGETVLLEVRYTGTDAAGKTAEISIIAQ